jgi:hypothetical protein
MHTNGLMFERNLLLLVLTENLCGAFRLLQHALTCASSPRCTHKTIAFICLGALAALINSQELGSISVRTKVYKLPARRNKLRLKAQLA